MSRFRVIKSQGKFYIVTTDSNGLAGGPFDDQAKAQSGADMLDVMEAMEAKRVADLAARAAQHRMSITPGYRSQDVEDGRGVTPPPGPEFYPERIQRAIRWNGTPLGQVPKPGWGGPPVAAKHHLPAPPDPYVPGTANQPAPATASLSSLLPKPDTWGDIRVRMGLPYRKAPGEK